MSPARLAAAWWLLAATACGRVGYDPIAEVSPDAGADTAPPPLDGAEPGPDVAGDQAADTIIHDAPDDPTGEPFPDRPEDVSLPDTAPEDRPPGDPPPITPASCVEPGGKVDPGTGHCYFMPSMSAMLWPEARAACEALGAHLATLTSSAEQIFAVSVLGTEELWIGLYRTGTGPWQWVTGEQATFAAWAPLEPDEPSDGRARLATDGWHDTDVRRRFLSLCERDP